MPGQEYTLTISCTAQSPEGLAETYNKCHAILSSARLLEHPLDGDSFKLTTARSNYELRLTVQERGE